MDSSVSPKDEICFLRVCHHISNAVCHWPVSTMIDIPMNRRLGGTQSLSGRFGEEENLLHLIKGHIHRYVNQKYQHQCYNLSPSRTHWSAKRQAVSSVSLARYQVSTFMHQRLSHSIMCVSCWIRVLDFHCAGRVDVTVRWLSHFKYG